MPLLIDGKVVDAIGLSDGSIADDGVGANAGVEALKYAQLSLYHRTKIIYSAYHRPSEKEDFHAQGTHHIQPNDGQRC